MNQEFWKNKKVLITGHTGFKGSWLSLWLQHLGADVVGYALTPPTEINLFETAQVAQGMTSIIGDVRDFVKLQQVIADHQPEIILHMAAQPLVRYSYNHTIETYETNVMGVVHLLEAVRYAKQVKVVVNVTTDKCYENKEWYWGYRENEPMGGYDPYSNSKGCSELVTSAFRNSFFNPKDFEKHGMALASARAGNVIGGGDWALDRLIPDIIQSCLNNQDLLIRSPHAIRPWQHVLEPLSGYLTLAEAMYKAPVKFCEAWNFGPEDADAKPVQWITDYLLKQWGEGLKWQLDENPQPHEASYLKLDCSKAKAELGWHPRWSLEVTLKSIVVWYKAYRNQDDMKKITLSQIENYMS